MRVYLGTAALQVGVGFILGALLGWALTRAYFVAMLRRIQRRVASLQEEYDRLGSTPAGEWSRSKWDAARPYIGNIETELRRRKL